MNFNDKYPNTKCKEFLDNNLCKYDVQGECFICQEFTQWIYHWSKRNSFGFPIMVKRHMCCDECLDYYDTMKGLMNE